MYYFGFKGCSGLIANFCENFYWKLNQKWDESDLDDDDDDDDDLLETEPKVGLV